MEIIVEETIEGLKTALAETAQALESFQEEAARLRTSNKICRAVIRSLRRQLNIAHLNDELMRALCAPDLVIEIEDDVEAQGGLPDANPSQTAGVQP
jgi:hypothetical protein